MQPSQPVMNGQSALWYLQRFNLFKHLPETDLRALANMSTMATVKKRERLYLPGESANVVYLLKKGLVKISRLSSEGKELVLAILAPGELFGELALAAEEIRDAQAEVFEDALICTIKTDDLLSFVWKSPELALRITKLIGFRRKQIEAKLEDLLFKDVPTRLAGVLLQLGKEYGVSSPEGVRFRVHFTHQDLADLIGATRETTSQLLAQWKREGIVAMNGRTLHLVDLARLESLAGAGFSAARQ